MNKIFSKVWFRSLGQLVVASELAKGGGKGKSGRKAQDKGESAGSHRGAGSTAFGAVISGRSGTPSFCLERRSITGGGRFRALFFVLKT